MKQILILGNIITMDEKRPFAKAALVKNGVFSYIGDAKEAKQLAGPDVQVLDYSENYIYPGFLESHSHGHLAGDRAIGQADLAKVGLVTDYAKYREIIKELFNRSKMRIISKKFVRMMYCLHKLIHCLLPEFLTNKTGCLTKLFL